MTILNKNGYHNPGPVCITNLTQNKNLAYINTKNILSKIRKNLAFMLCNFLVRKLHTMFHNKIWKVFFGRKNIRQWPQM